MTAIDWQTTDPIPEDVPFLSFGGGRNSVALYILPEQEGQPFIALMADPGAERPETYEYVAWMQDNGHPVTMMPTYRTVKGLRYNIAEYYWMRKTFPVRFRRDCTSEFKVRPLQSIYGERDPMIAIAADESHRLPGANRPLVERGIDLPGCLSIIAGNGWPIPVKSGCYFCPFSTRPGI